MARFYLDEDVKVLLAPYLEEAGHSALTAVEAGNLQAWDADELSFAVRRRRILITHNRRDYRALHEAWVRWRRGPHHGILTLEQPLGYRAADYVRVILDFLATAPPSLDNRMYDWFARRDPAWEQWRPLPSP